ncbi:MAG: response regulator transcription factor [Clostridia bacterium]|nr:response regulator transcription factor [Clostridia bacterium]
MNSDYSILITDDDRDIVRAISIYLENEGYRTYKAYDGMEALDIISSKQIHLLLIDIMMPKLDGLSAIMKLRADKNIPVIILSAKSEDTDKILGLSIGADDYVTKPFNPQELIARCRAQLRRYTDLGSISTAKSGMTVTNGALCLDREQKQLYVSGDAVKLTATEYKIIELLMTNAGRVFPAEEIYERVWNEDAYACENTVMVHIRRIREKIEINPREPEYLKVVWGIGYKIEKK